jgi:hypothetical protein
MDYKLGGEEYSVPNYLIHHKPKRVKAWKDGVNEVEYHCYQDVSLFEVVLLATLVAGALFIAWRIGLPMILYVFNK